MAKSKSGGTRSYIRGRVGSDVYSIGKDAKGKKQQVVRSLAESVANPQTQAQMRGRMIMATIAQALAELRVVCDHSFDNVVGARANLSEFTSRNYGLIKADIAAHAAGGNSFGLVLYGQRGAKRGCYVVSDGNASVPVALAFNAVTAVATITLDAESVTVQGLKNALGMTSDEYFTLVGLTEAGKAVFERFRINPNFAASTAITADNVADMFLTEGNGAAAVALATNKITITMSAIAQCSAVIISKKSNGKYIHNEAVLSGGVDFPYNANVALPTYPVGSENYLNGGDVNGMRESASDVEDEEQGGGGGSASTSHALTITKSGNGTSTVTVGGTEIASGASVEEGATIHVSIVPAEGQTPTARFNGTLQTLTQSSGAWVGDIQMASADSTLVLNSGVSGDPGQN